MKNKGRFIIFGVVVLTVLIWYLVKNYPTLNHPPVNNNITNQTDDKTTDSVVRNIENKTSKSAVTNTTISNKPNNSSNPIISGVCSPTGTKTLSWATFSASHLVSIATVVEGSPTIITDSNRKVEFRQGDVPIGTKIYYCSVAPRTTLPFIGSAMALNISGAKKDDKIPFMVTTMGVPLKSSDSMESVYDFVQFQHLASGKDMIGFGWSQLKDGVIQKALYFDPEVVYAVFNVETGMPLLVDYIEVPQF